eukprot:m.487091 g.487091  ORF g.487091 m.487091 type:complete len:523 (-) comp57220_c1_seq1:953-2521(-)
MVLAPGTIIRGWSVGPLLGKGAHGAVYSAINEIKASTPTHRVAIKSIDRKNLSKSAEDNIVKEIELLLKLKHPHIVQLVDFHCDAKGVYILMEFCNGGDLHQHIYKAGPFSEQVVQGLFQQIGIAMKYLRSQQIAHLDLKPQNVLLQVSQGKSITMKLADFGLSQTMHDDDTQSRFRGSPLYMAPEVFLGHYDARVDIYSAGIILFEMLFMRTPFVCATLDELLPVLARCTLIEIPSTPSISSSCRDLLQRMLAIDPEHRITYEQYFAHDFLDLVHLPSDRSLGLGRKQLQKAIDFEQAGQLQQAYDCYCDALSHLLAASQFTTQQSAKDSIKSTMLNYMAHTEELKALLAVAKPLGSPRPSPVSVRKDQSIMNSRPATAPSALSPSTKSPSLPARIEPSLATSLPPAQPGREFDPLGYEKIPAASNAKQPKMSGAHYVDSDHDDFDIEPTESDPAEEQFVVVERVPSLAGSPRRHDCAGNASNSAVQGPPPETGSAPQSLFDSLLTRGKSAVAAMKKSHYV